ncbi:MAG: YggS family pyridoxal phosphate-dependent enzyme [Clostridia bacterium]|nr:YggS family pyridoxal phosphate-dependent enzyme [Clostridia bacterium]
MALEYIKNNLESLREELLDISNRCGVKIPTLVAVTKSGTDEELLALAAAGISDVGENRPGEVKRRGELLREHGFSPRMHEIGTLQRNKIKLIIDTAAMIHSIDSYKLAYDVDRLAEKCQRRIPVLIEVNSAGEEAKSGVSPDECERLLCEILPLKNIIVSGLMTMGPALDDPEGLRPYFRDTKRLFDRLSASYGFGECPTLSMGMSDSYKVAIEEGSTLVRVGRKLFKK